ncbi:TSUP family transporter [Ferrimonas sp. SCSIO 43195]|uniref:TSUP family transporter n=1 Tax=Ferrimonas sp. SCSIO 43195 TaxID=2822844 RepID=UPI002074C6DD|nr:TSUP family transporter [Ferrimonas sp. SCSIO 43195]USD36437.1 TSUP family transporter [Ferrimonas sp. SCSIO 43195]
MIELGLDLNLMLLLSAVAFAAGFIDAVAGGGGLLTIPALLTAGLPPHLALGTNKLAASFGSLTASWTYYRKQLFNPSFWRKSFVATFIGAAAGTLAVDQFSADILNRLLPLVIVAIALYTLCAPSPSDEHKGLPERTLGLKVKQWTQGLGLGFYDGFAGPGTGAFWTVSSMMLYKMNILLSSGLARSMNFVSNATSLGFFIALGHVHFGIGIAMGVCLMAGAWIGAHSAIRFGSKFIRPVFITMVLIIAGKLALEAWL